MKTFLFIFILVSSLALLNGCLGNSTEPNDAKIDADETKEVGSEFKFVHACNLLPKSHYETVTGLLFEDSDLDDPVTFWPKGEYSLCSYFEYSTEDFATGWGRVQISHTRYPEPHFDLSKKRADVFSDIDPQEVVYEEVPNVGELAYFLEGNYSKGLQLFINDKINISIDVRTTVGDLNKEACIQLARDVIASYK